MAEQRCETHRFEPALGTCMRCGYPYCGSCLVYPSGLQGPPLCVRCAGDGAGLRAAGPVRGAARMRARRSWDRV